MAGDSRERVTYSTNEGKEIVGVVDFGANLNVEIQNLDLHSQL